MIYGGPGSVITGIGALVATLAALAATVLGFLWFPLKRLFQAIRVDDEEPDGEPDAKNSEGKEGGST